MKIFAVGCSFSSFHSGKCGLGNSWIHQIAKNYPDAEVYDASLGGAGNDSIQLRFRFLEQKYGKPDKVIVQLTNPARLSILFNDVFWKNGLNYETIDNLTYHDDERLHSYFLSGSFFNDDKITKRKKIRPKLAQNLGVAEQSLVRYFGYYLGSYDNCFKTQIAIENINRIYGESNTMFFLWHSIKEFYVWKYVDLPKNYIGSVQDRFHQRNQFYKYGTDKSPHYDVIGHTAVFKWLRPKIDALLGDK